MTKYGMMMRAGLIAGTLVTSTAMGQQEVRTTRSSDVVLQPPTDVDGFVFVVYGDRTGGPAEGIVVLKQAVEDTNLLDPDLVMTVGDLIQGYNQTDEWMNQMRQYKQVMSELDAPWYPVAGNHDVYWRGPDRPAEEHEGNYEANFGPLWYDFPHKNAHFIVLYTDEGNPETGERNFGKPDCQVMSPEQTAFLEEALERASTADHVFVFMHHPRWMQGRYGQDWERIHELLAKPGNVRACFAGHIHQMRHDGTQDGIEYVALATVGGGQSFHAPEAGWNHEYHVITVRPDRFEMAAIPVGEILDVRAITGEVSEDTRAIAKSTPAMGTPIDVAADGSANGTLTASVTNPARRPITIVMKPESRDARWSFTPGERHLRIGPGETSVVRFDAARSAGMLDDSFHPPALRLQSTYIGTERGFEIPESTHLYPVGGAAAVEASEEES